MPENRLSKNTLLYEGSVKRIYTAKGSSESAADTQQLIFEFTDDYSVFDWGKMPDTIPQKGLALATLTAGLFERLQSASEWKTYLASGEGQKLVQDLQLSPEQIGQLTEKGLHTHYKKFLGDRDVVVEKIKVQRPTKVNAFGQSYYAYPPPAEAPFLIPLEVVFRFELTSASSFLKRNAGFKPGHVFDRPYVEMFTKLEDKDRPLAFSEAFAISGLSTEQFSEVIWKTSLVCGLLKFWFGAKGIRLIDGKLEWGLAKNGEVMLVDAIGPDEMRIEKNGTQLSKEILRDFYRPTSWYTELENAKVQAEGKAGVNWKSGVSQPGPLPGELKTAVSEMYQALVNDLVPTSKFAVKPLDSVIADLQKLLGGRS